MDLKPSQRRRLASLARHRAISRRVIADNTPKRAGMFLRFILLFL